MIMSRPRAWPGYSGRTRPSRRRCAYAGRPRTRAAPRPGARTRPRTPPGSGAICLQVVGSTGGITTIEYEPGALADLERALERIAPASGRYEHNERWHDGNGFSHLRSAILGTSMVVPFRAGELALGTWQQIVVLNFDNRDRERRLVGHLLAG